MRVIRSPRQMALVSQRLAQQGKRIGLVPTMGALHEGHLSLIRRAASQNDVVIVTVFVNPLQFGPREPRTTVYPAPSSKGRDERPWPRGLTLREFPHSSPASQPGLPVVRGEGYAHYPRTLARDIRLSRAAGADIVFAPSVSALYPKGFQTTVEAGPLAARWEGTSRPDHFRGVATVVTLLIELTRPANAYFGQKDYQQALIVERLVRDLRLSPKLHVLPTVREPDGLAMSSRNAYLSPSQRAQAGVLYRALGVARAKIRAGERRARPILRAMRRLIRRARDARIDYAAIVDAATLEPQRRLRGRVAILLAVCIGPTRLIDNLLVDVS